MRLQPPRSTLFPYTTLFRSGLQNNHRREYDIRRGDRSEIPALDLRLWSHTLEAKYFNHRGKLKYKTGVQAKLNDNTDRKSTRLNSSHSQTSYAVFCLKKKKR